jgi:hypothetical protein
MTQRDDLRHIYRLDSSHLPADTILYDAGLEIPQIDDSISGLLEYYFRSCNVTVAVEPADTKGNAEIRVWVGEGDTMIGLSYQQINLLSSRAVANLVRELKESQPQIKNWREIINNVAWRAVNASRKTQQLQAVGAKPETMRQHFRLFPIIHEGEPTTIYCPGGVGKSYLAIYCACLVQFDYQGFTEASDSKMWSPTQGNVLYADWESSHNDHLRRTWAVKRGLGITDDTGEFLYLACEQPLSAILSDIQAIIEEHDIKLVIIDSQMAAADFGPDIGQNATRFFNAVRQLHCSTLILDHVSKSAMQMADDSNSTGPHGSVVKGNRSRQQYELKKHQVPGQSHTDLVLMHRKNNEGPLGEAFGIRIAFLNDDQGHLDQVKFTAFEVSEHPIMSATQPVWKRIWDAVDGGGLTLGELCELMPDKTEGTIKATLYQNKDRFTKRNGDQWWRQAGYQP